MDITNYIINIHKTNIIHEYINIVNINYAQNILIYKNKLSYIYYSYLKSNNVIGVKFFDTFNIWNYYRWQYFGKGL